MEVACIFFDCYSGDGNSGQALFLATKNIR